MFITNDVALLTFVPLAIAILQRFGQKRLIFVVALQTVAANLGSMLMPTGNPQNLYLYSYYNFSMANFLKVTAPITLISLVFITIASLLGKNSFVQVDFPERARIKEIKKLYLYLLLFLLCLLTVFGVLNYWVVFFIVCLTLIVVDRTTLKKIDYSLLLTFIFFFIFVGNLERIERVSVVISQAIAGREYLLSILICQVVSNVPAAIMLSGFTENGEALVLGSNIGGLGSLIASLASLISFRLYTRSKGAQGKKYFLCFTGINLILLVLLAIIGFVFFLF